jgi:hypothetical protein
MARMMNVWNVHLSRATTARKDVFTSNATTATKKIAANVSVWRKRSLMYIFFILRII